MLITIHTPTRDLSESIEFYTKLGFKQLSTQPVIFTDGKAVIEINPDRYARAGIKLYQSEWQGELELINMLTQVTRADEAHLFTDPSGVYLYATERQPTFMPETADSAYSVLGNFAGLSLETADLKRSSALYETIGFHKAGGSPETGYISFELDGFAINLMRPLTCPHLFFNPSMTYFNGGNNMAVIEKIRALGISITEEITHFNKEGLVDNVIIRDPGGYDFFVFND
jgi:predicted lactoylglutathione lyase